MVIQRWQSVFLLLAVVCMALSAFLPFCSVAGAPVTPINYVAFFVVNLTAALLALLAIFMYKNMKRQITMTKVVILLTVVSLALNIILIAYIVPDAEVSLTGIVVPCCALLAEFWGLRCIKADQKLLRSADRLR